MIHGAGCPRIRGHPDSCDMTRTWGWIGAVLFVGLLSYGVSRLASTSDVSAGEGGARETIELQRLQSQVRNLEASFARSEQLAREARATAPRVAPEPVSEAMSPPDASLHTEALAEVTPEPTPDEEVARMDARFFSEGGRQGQDADAWDGPFMAALTGTPGRSGEVEAVAYLARAGVDLAP